jgi:DNA-binding GntR family transcriptional regulator
MLSTIIHPGALTLRRPGDSAERVREYLEKRIIEGDLRPGQRLIEKDISQELGLSRSPVREALRSLTADGLVEFHPRRGGYVTYFSLEEIGDTFLVFEALETLSTGLAATGITGPQIKALRRLLLDMRRAVAADDVGKYFQLNARFHQTIYQAAGNRPLERLLLNLGKQLTRFRFAALGTPGRVAISLQEHRRLVAALERGDEARAIELARLSVIHARRALLVSLGVSGRATHAARGRNVRERR